MNTPPLPSDRQPPNVAGAIAHEVFNLLTVVYGLQDDADKLDDDVPGKMAIVSGGKTIAERLDLVGRRLVELSRNTRNDTGAALPDARSAEE